MTRTKNLSLKNDYYRTCSRLRVLPNNGDYLRRRTLLLITVLALCGCSDRAQTVRDESYEVHRAALGFMLGRSASKSAQAEYSAFVVPKEYARHFSDIRPPVVPNDEKRYSTETGSAIDHVTGKHVMLWSVSQAKISGDSATCYVTWWVGNLGAGGHSISLRKIKGVWIAEREEMLWISQTPNKAPAMVFNRQTKSAFYCQGGQGERTAAAIADSCRPSHPRLTGRAGSAIHSLQEPV